MCIFQRHIFVCALRYIIKISCSMFILLLCSIFFFSNAVLLINPCGLSKVLRSFETPEINLGLYTRCGALSTREGSTQWSNLWSFSCQLWLNSMSHLCNALYFGQVLKYVLSLCFWSNLFKES